MNRARLILVALSLPVVAAFAQPPAPTAAPARSDTPAFAQTPPPLNAPARSDTPAFAQTPPPLSAPARTDTAAFAQTPPPLNTPARTDTAAFAQTPPPVNAPARSDTAAFAQTPPPVNAPARTDTAAFAQTPPPVNAPARSDTAAFAQTPPPVNAPARSDTAAFAQTPPPLDAPARSDTAAFAQTPPPVSAPARSDTPAFAQTPPPVAAPARSDTPAFAQTPPPVSAPARSDTPAFAQTPPPLSAPARSDTPAFAQTPPPVAAPARSDTPAFAQTPPPVSAPARSDTPAFAQTPPPLSAPARSDTPAFAQTPPPLNAPARSDTPAFAQTPPPVNAPARTGIAGATPLTLNEAIDKVLANDQSLVIARIDRGEAGLNLTGALGAYDPRAGFSAGRSRVITPVGSLFGGAADGKLTTETYQADPQISGLSPAFGGSYKLDFSSSRQTTDSSFTFLNPQYNTALSLSLTQPLWRGLRYDENRYRIQVARRNIDLSVEQLRGRLIDTVTQTIQAYWELEFALRNLDVQTQAVQLAEQQDSSNRRQVGQGLLAPVDVVQTQTQIATFRQNMLTAQQLVTAAENALKVLMLADRNDPLWNMAITTEALPDNKAAPMPLDDAVKLALDSRPELKQSMIALAINQLDVRRAHEQTKPQLDATAAFSSVGLAGLLTPAATSGTLSAFLPAGAAISPALIGGYGQSLSDLTGGHFTTATVGVTMSLPIRNRAAEAQSAVALSESRRLEAMRKQVELAIEQDVRNALQGVTTAAARLEAASDARHYAEEQYASEQRQFQAGTSTVFLVLQRQTDLIAALTREARARADLGEASANLDRATARTLDARKIEVR